ncbi:ATP-binding protein [Plantactinospora sp. KBS50]|uniref:sensor histidine kinase n=1 Tax=Plantactinospora sp. KBS50 TaxID=2024580 RepID=UPI000BAAF9AA|nr:sensor histidine kinase [Plantactinospora sp. KBS50]ASW56747.1 histidine kinase [Plantactinospora sp. KBS50]
MKRGNWSLRQRVVTLCVTVGVLLTGLAVAEAALAAQNRGAIDRILNVTGPLRVQGEVLLNSLVNQETGVRGYAVTGVRSELEPYETGRQQERSAVATMDRLLAGEPAMRAQLLEVERQAEHWRQTVAEPVIEATGSQGRAAGQALLTDETRQEFDQLRATIAELQQSILVLRQQAVAAVNRTGNSLVVLLVIAAIVVVIAGVALLLSLNRLVIGPVTTLASRVRQVATGDYGAVIERVGPPEVARLAGDVDGMRKRIAADLAEVQAARANIEEANARLQQQAEELVRSNRDLEQFAYVASHDLQEPLRKVASFCQLLQRRYAGQLDERADQYIAFAVDGAQRMQRLINDLLAFSRIGRVTTGFTEVDLARVMGDVAGQTEAARQYADAELTWTDLPVVRGEEALLTNLVANLVSNSIKFRRADVPPRVHVSARRVGDEWEITCQDNGIGIEAEFADKIFVIFQRLHSKDAYPGTGIGLAIVKKIVEYHGGRVWVDSDVPEGTAIRFTLPALPDPAEAQPTPAPAGSEPAAQVASGPDAEAGSAPATGGAVDGGGAGEPAPAGRADAGDEPANGTAVAGRSAARDSGDAKETVA